MNDLSDVGPPPWPRPVVLKMLTGALVGLFEVCVALPLDVTKTRLQMQTTRPGDPVRYRGVLDCILMTYKTEGLLSLWKGFLPSLFIKVPKMSSKFLVFDEFYQLLDRMGYLESPSAMQAWAGVCVGVSEAILFNPFEVIKVTVQTSVDQSKQAPSAWSVGKKVYREHGLGSRGLYKGLIPSICSNGCFNFVFLGAFYKANEFIEDFKGPIHIFSSKFVFGMTGCSAACVCNIPFDVVKTRIQGRQPVEGKVKYQRMFQTMSTIYREEGFWAFYKGLGPKIMRIGPCGTVMILLFDYVNGKLRVDDRKPLK